MRRVKTKGSARSWGSKAPSDPPFNEMIGKHPSAKGDALQRATAATIGRSAERNDPRWSDERGGSKESNGVSPHRVARRRSEGWPERGTVTNAKEGTVPNLIPPSAYAPTVPSKSHPPTIVLPRMRPHETNQDSSRTIAAR